MVLLHFYPSTLPQVSVGAVTIIMVLSHAIFLPPMPVSAAPSVSIRRIMPDRFIYLDTSAEKLQPPAPMQPAVAVGTRQLHPYTSPVSGGAVGSSRNVEDQAVRALVGSSPPKCVKKCGVCTPCKSVLVPIHTSNLPATPAEYYPEAWRCQCKGKIYNP